jgi:hypothetical protein
MGTVALTPQKPVVSSQWQIHSFMCVGSRVDMISLRGNHFYNLCSLSTSFCLVSKLFNKDDYHYNTPLGVPSDHEYSVHVSISFVRACVQVESRLAEAEKNPFEFSTSKVVWK